MPVEKRRKKVDVFAAAAVFATCVCASLQTAADESSLLWATVSNESALCNDFTQAGFFHRRPTESGAGKWIVFLESGGVCFSNETCNRRYFNSTVRDRESSDEHANNDYGDFNTVDALRKYNGTNFVNPLMTSVQCFNNTSFFPDGLRIQGRDLFDRTLNHSLAGHGQVVVPYCSSDVWLGVGKRDVKKSPCGCLQRECFEYEPNASRLQFTFRGKTIFQSVMRDLDAMYNLSGSATELILIGSSAGGVGVMNLVKWVTQQFPNLTVKVITDSAWFINFRDGINQQFSNLSRESDSSSSVEHFTSSSVLIGQSSHVITPTKSTTSHMISSSQMMSSSQTQSSLSMTPSGNIVLPSPSIMTSSPNIPSASPTPTASGSGSGDNNMVSNEEEEEMMKRYAPMEFAANQFAEERDRRDVATDDSLDLLRLLEFHEACSDTRRGYPCCLSAQCLLSSSHRQTYEPYFPSNVSLFVVTSLYDAFILSRAVQSVQVYHSDMDNTPIGLAVEYLTLLGEYGGVMDNSLMEIKDSGRIDISFYASQCFQHIYFATSTLWGEGRLLGSDPVQINEEIGAFRHSIQSGVWNESKLASSDGMSYTIMDAIDVWYQNGSSGMNFRDICRTPHCNLECPEKFIFQPLQPKEWPMMARFAVGAVVVAIVVFCIVLKGCFYLWLKLLEHKQVVYLNSITPVDSDEEASIAGSAVEEGLRREFPMCTAAQAISVACLDLRYSVTTSSGRQLKDEKRENFAPIVLSDLSPEQELNGSETDPQEEPSECDELLEEGRRRTLSSSSGALQKLKNAFTPHTGTYHVPTFRPENENIDESLHRLANGSAPRKKSSGRLPFNGRTSRTSNQSQDTFEEIPFKTSRTSDMCSSLMKKVFRTKRKKILKGISVYFNPGEMVGIMGPSGCGKTTFLDILTGRRKNGIFSGEIFINGAPLEENREWYISNTGYVIQLARPYYEELTVRENLTLAAWIKLKDTAREKFQRVEQVMDVCGLLDLADTVVGGATGPGLSGGQKRRLAVALQLLKLPSVIFLDEPTSGLDAASSRELLAHLNDLAGSNRTVVLTIHQPRLEIFHMFDRLVLLSDGKVAYHGVPDKAYEVFVNALRSRYLQQRLIIPDLEDRNPADVIMDMLGNQRMRQFITDYYQSSGEPKLVNQAVKQAWTRERKYSLDLMDGNEGDGTTLWGQIKFILKGTRKAENTQNQFLSRIAALEARATKRATPFVMAYLPIIFFAYGVLLGTVYLQQDQPFLIVSGFCVYSVASALFMFPALFSYYQKALEIYSFEHADGAGRAYDLVIQPFVRFITMATVPVIACALVLYMLLVDITRWSWPVFGQLVVVNIALNQAWVALLIWLILSFPKVALRLSPPLASIMGFTSGFFIPIGDIPWWYRWLTYINPNYYGFSASAFLLLKDFETTCQRQGDATELECFPESGEYILQRFDFKNINPYYNITILVAMAVFYLLLSVFSNFCNHTTLNRGMKKVRIIARRLKRAASIDTASVFSAFESDEDTVSYSRHLDEREDILASNEPEEEEEEEEEAIAAALGPLSPIAENQEEREDLIDPTSEEREVITHTWEHPPERFYPNGGSHLPTSLPEIPSAVSPNPVSPRDKAREHWSRAVEITRKQRSNSIELDTFASAQSEPPTPEKNVVFQEAFRRRRTSRMNSLGEGLNQQGRRRKKSVRSVYLRDGEVHAVWKPSAPSPIIPTPPPSHFVDVVHEVMRQHGKVNLRERQRQLLSRVTATQQVLKEQNEELAAVAEMTEEDEEKEEEKEGGQRSMSAPGQRDTPGRKMWQHLIKSVINEKKESEKNRKRNRKRSTVHFHKVVTNKLASMDPAGPRGLPSISEQGDAVPGSTPISPQKVRRKTSMSWKRDAVTPGGAIPFTEWKNHFYERQRLTRQDTMKQFKSDYNLKTKAAAPYSGLPRINSDNHLTFPVNRRASVTSGEELEPRSKSVSQYRRTHVKLRRSSSPDVLDYSDYDDHGEISDTSVALDDMFSPLSSRSVSPSVFSDEEEQRRSKMLSRTPTAGRSHQPLVKLDSEEVRVLGNPSNMHKRARHHHHRQQHQDTTHSGDDIIEIDNPEATVQSGHHGHVTPKKRPKRVSISLPASPRGTPSPRPTTPQSNLASARVASPPPTTHRGKLRDSALPSPSILNDRISREQHRRESLPHLLELAEEEVQPLHRRAATPDSHYYHRPPSNTRRSSTPTTLNLKPPPAPSSAYGSHRILTPSPPPPIPLLSEAHNEPRRGPGEGRYTLLHSPTGNSYMSQTTV